MRRWPLLGGVILLALLLPLFTYAQSGELQALTMTHDGLERDYLLYVPETYNAAKPAPLVIVLHGGMGTARSMLRLTRNGFNHRADENGWLVAYPQGINGRWVDGRAANNQIRNGQQVNDTNFLIALVNHIHKTTPLDRKRIFVTGVSNGGAMSFALACNRADRIAAIVPITMSLPVELDCAPSEPVPLLVINGTADPIIPYDEAMAGWQRDDLLSTPDTVTFWRTVNECTDEPLTTTLDNDPDDGTSVRVQTYIDCEAPITLITVLGGGHTWPGGRVLPVSQFGRTSHEFSATDAIWDFFAAQSPDNER